MEYLLEKSTLVPFEFPSLSRAFFAFINIDVFLEYIKLDITQDSVIHNQIKYNLVEFYKTHDYFNIPLFEIGCVNNEFYLMNNFEWYSVLKDLKTVYTDIQVSIKCYQLEDAENLDRLCSVVVQSDSKLHMSNVYNAKCKNKPYMKSTSDTPILDGIVDYVNKTYPSYVTKAIPYKPNINLDHLCVALKESAIIKKLNIKSSKEFIVKFEELNNFYKCSLSTMWQSWKIDDTMVHKCRSKSIMKPLFLGLFRYEEWITRLIKRSEPTNISTKNFYNRIPHLSICNKSRKISKAKRRKVWAKRNNPKSMVGKCRICNEAIDYDTFEAGHVVAAFWGGSTALSNLEPICSPCNKDQSITNLYEYKNEFYK